MRRERRAAVAFAGPALVAATLFFVVPTAAAMVLSLTDFDIYALADLRDLRWVGLANYRALLGDPLFGRALLNTLVFACVGVPAALAASLGAALLIEARTVRWKAVWRVALFAPYVTTLIATAVLWRYVLDARYGLLNRALGVVGIAPVDWLGDPRTSIPAITLFIVWKNFGYNMIVFSAALTAVPSDLMDAARLDGAGAWMRFRHVVLPAIGPVLLLAALLSMANFLQIFDEPYVMTKGGPAGATVTILYFMVQQGFEWWSLGYASAVAVVLFVLTLAVTAVQVRLGRRREWI
ncbi:MAG: carbohydrate ABC transporter permease [Janthinobacterium lividum]